MDLSSNPAQFILKSRMTSKTLTFFYLELAAHKRGVIFSILERSLSRGAQILFFFFLNLLLGEISLTQKYSSEKIICHFLFLKGEKVGICTALKTSVFFLCNWKNLVKL